MTTKLIPKLKTYTIAEAAEMLGYRSTSVLYQEIRAGRMHARMRRGNLRCYRITEADLQEWVDAGLVDVYETKFAPGAVLS